MAEAKERGHDCIITIGGIQSNHARATVGAAGGALCSSVPAGGACCRRGGAAASTSSCRALARLAAAPHPSSLLGVLVWNACAAGGGSPLPGVGVPPHPSQQPPPGGFRWVQRCCANALLRTTMSHHCQHRCCSCWCSPCPSPPSFWPCPVTALLRPGIHATPTSYYAAADPGLVGNLLVERLIGAHVWQVRPLRARGTCAEHAVSPCAHARRPCAPAAACRRAAGHRVQPYKLLARSCPRAKPTSGDKRGVWPVRRPRAGRAAGGAAAGAGPQPVRHPRGRQQLHGSLGVSAVQAEPPRLHEAGRRRTACGGSSSSSAMQGRAPACGRRTMLIQGHHLPPLHNPLPPGCIAPRSYIEMVHELKQQIAGQGFTDLVMVRLGPRQLGTRDGNWSCRLRLGFRIKVHSYSCCIAKACQPLFRARRGRFPTSTRPHVQACGSGGTTAGIGLGNHLSGLGLRVHAMAVCDDEEYFYSYVGCWGSIREGRGGVRAAGGSCRGFARPCQRSCREFARPCQRSCSARAALEGCSGAPPCLTTPHLPHGPAGGPFVGGPRGWQGCCGHRCSGHVPVGGPAGKRAWESNGLAAMHGCFARSVVCLQATVPPLPHPSHNHPSRALLLPLLSQGGASQGCGVRDQPGR